MDDIWLIYNPRSKACDEKLVAEVEQLFFDAGKPISRKFLVGEDDLPDGRVARMADVETIIILSGDGTASATADGLAGWNGTLLLLPGGTMNLLAHALHGDAPVAEIVTAMLAGQGETTQVPVIRVGDQTAYAGIIVGPSSAWADVREDMRNFDIAALPHDAAQAIEATFKEPGVGIVGTDSVFPAIYLEPRAQGISAAGVQAETARDLIAHGWAWLTGDFRQGPSQQLKVDERLTLASQSDSFDMLVDGERAESDNPATFTPGLSDVRFYSLLGEARWS